MVDSHDDLAPSEMTYSRNTLGYFAFATALCGLVFFWVPVAGVSLWALGLGMSFIGCFKAPRGFGVAGVFVSLISFAFMGYFLVLPSWLAVPVEKIVHREILSEKKSAEGTPSGRAGNLLSEILASFHYEDKSEPEKTVAEEKPEPASDELPQGDDEVWTDDDFEGDEDSGGEASPAEVPGNSHSFPIARFTEIAKHRTTWPRRVRLTRSRTISLWDSERKEIMGKMEVPAKTVVEVLDVRPDGSLFVLDCTQQAFVVLAADTDFARVYVEKNPEKSSDEEW